MYSARRYLLHNESIGPIASEIQLKPQQCSWHSGRFGAYFCKLKQCIRRGAACWAQRVDTQVDWPNSFWDMTKWKPYFCKLKKQQCIRRRATCWAQRVDTQVVWTNSFWDMRKCLKPYFCKLKKQQCIRRGATCWAQRVDTQVVWTNSFWDMTKCLKPYFCKLKTNTTVHSARRCLLSTTRWHSGRLAK